MVRKRNLSDLLRDEADSLDDADEPSAAEQTIDVAAEVAEDTQIEPARRAQPTKAELQAIVTDLTVELEAVRDRNQQLEAKIAQLEIQLESRSNQQAQIDALQQQIEQMQQQTDRSTELTQMQQRLEAEQAQITQLKAELEEARQTILKLTETNRKPEAKPIDRASPPARPPLQAKPLPQKSGAIQPARPPVPPVPPARPGIQPVRPYVPARPIAPNNIPIMPSENDTRLSDSDIGWVD